MKLLLFFTFSVLFTHIIIAQQIIQNEEGRKIILNGDGTWKYLENEVNEKPIYYVYINGKQLEAGRTETIREPDSQYGYGVSTSVTVAKEGAHTMIIFWQSTGEKQFGFIKDHWTGTVTLFLDNGSTIRLIDRNLHGENIISEGFYNRLRNNYTDLYQSWSAYYLTASECQQLKESSLSRVAYQLKSNTRSTNSFHVNRNKSTLRDQLLSIGR